MFSAQSVTWPRTTCSHVAGKRGCGIKGSGFLVGGPFVVDLHYFVLVEGVYLGIPSDMHMHERVDKGGCFPL